MKNNERIDLVLMTANREVQPLGEKYFGMTYHDMMEFTVTRDGRKENVSVKMVNFNKAGVSKHQKKRDKEIRDLSVP